MIVDPTILKLLGVLEQLHEDKGVPKQDALVNKNVIKSDNSTFDSDKKEKSGLSSKHKKTLVETFTLFNQMFFDYQKKMRVDEKEKTKVSQIAKKQATPPPLPQSNNVDKGSSILSMILGGLSLLAGSVGAIVGALSGFFGDFGGVVKTIGKLGFIGALKIISKTILKRFSLAILKRLPVIGGIIGLGFAVKAFMNGDIFLGIAELISGLLNFIPGVGPILSLGADVLIAFAQSKGMFDKGGALSPENGWKTIKGWVSNIGDAIMDNALYLPIIGTFKRFGMAYDAFKGGDISDGLKQMGLGLLTMIPSGGILIKGMEILAGWMSASKEPDGDFNADKSWLGKMKQWIVKKLNDLPEILKAPLRWFGILDDESKDINMNGVSQGAKDGSKGVMEFVGGVWDKVKGPMKDTVDSLGDFAKEAWNKTKLYSSKAWDVVSEEAPKIWESVKTSSEKAWGYITEEAPKIWESVKELSAKAWDKAKEAGSWFVDSVNTMSEKTKNMINQWISGIVDMVSGISTTAMNVLKNIADKIGGWIANLFTPEEEKKMSSETSPISKKEELLSQKNDMFVDLLGSNNVQNNWLNLLHQSSLEQIRLLGMMVNIGNSSLSELKRIGKNPSSSGNTTYISPQQGFKADSINIDNNRMGYASSAYALG
jgi:hypothetical protein